MHKWTRLFTLDEILKFWMLLFPNTRRSKIEFKNVSFTYTILNAAVNLIWKNYKLTDLPKIGKSQIF